MPGSVFTEALLRLLSSAVATRMYCRIGGCPGMQHMRVESWWMTVIVSNESLQIDASLKP